MVDHNNPSQSPDGINEKNIVGVYDHHMQELILRQKIYPISYSPVGATATIIAQTYRAKRLQIPPDIAGILMAAIISDTDNLKSSTTTDEDRVEVKHLAEIANIKDIDAFVEELLAQRDRALEGKTPAELIKFDMKSCGSVNISQIKVSNANQFVSDKQKYKEALNQLDSETSSKGSILMITDSNENATYLLVSDKMRKIAQKALEVGDSKILDTKIQDSTNDVRSSLETLKNEDSVLKLFNVHSRKKQIQPFVSQLIEMTNN